MTISNLFKGRIGRAHFGWWLLAHIGVSILTAIVMYAFGLLGDVLAFIGDILAVVVYVALTIVSIGMAMRRYRDMDWTPWFVILNIIPFVNVVMLIILLVKQGTPGANRFGEPFPQDVPLVEAILGTTSGMPVTAAAAPATTAPAEPVQAAAPAETTPVTEPVHTQPAAPEQPSSQA